MKNRLKVLLLTGVLSLSAIGAVEFTYAEDMSTAEEVKTQSEDSGASEASEEPTPDPEPTPAPEPTPEPTPAPDPEPEPTPTPDPEPTPDIPAEPETPTPDTTPATDTEAPTESTESETSSETISEVSSETETESEAETNAKKKDKDEKEIDKEAADLYEQTTGESIYVFGSYPVGDITENTNEIYDYLRNVLGLNHAAACGVLANIQCESNFASSAVGDGGTSYGLCQWHLGRFSALINWCNANGYEYHSIQGQMGYLTTELQGGYASVYQYLLNVPDTAQGAYDAAYYWCKYFEIPANLEYNSQMRADLAMNLYYPKTLGTQKEADIESEITSLNDEQMEQVLEAAPESISRLSRLNVSREATVSQALSDNGVTGMSEALDRKSLEEEAQQAIEQALAEYQASNTETEADSETEQETETDTFVQISSEELAVLGNAITLG